MCYCKKERRSLHIWFICSFENHRPFSSSSSSRPVCKHVSCHVRSRPVFCLWLIDTCVQDTIGHVLAHRHIVQDTIGHVLCLWAEWETQRYVGKTHIPTIHPVALTDIAKTLTCQWAGKLGGHGSRPVQGIRNTQNPKTQGGAHKNRECSVPKYTPLRLIILRHS
jgi:hypothetical protein